MIEHTITPWTEDRLRDLADRVINASGAEQTEVALSGGTSFLTRFANNQIHQNVHEQDLEVRLRVAYGLKVGHASTNDLSNEGLARALRDAEAVAKLQPDNPEFPGFALPKAITPVAATHDTTLAYTPGDRAKVVGHVCDDAQREGLTASGSFATGLRQVAIANSLGVWAYHQHTLADFNTVVMSDDSSGWAAATSLDAAHIDGEALAEEAIDKALRSRRPRDLEPGVYTVILEPYAVQDLLQYLAGFGAGAEEVREGRSFMSGREGERVAHKDLSIYDDGHDLTGIPMPFDYEGTPTQRVEILTRGRIGRPVYDLRNAKIEGTVSTGHYSGGSQFWGGGARPCHLFMAPGVHTTDEMLETTERGIWITRFHYVNRLDAKKTTITGMTRDGTFWIENGRIVHPLKNLRFTQSILEALAELAMIGDRTQLELNWFGGGNRAPALKINRFRFSGKTSF